jgi:hypothetical protein
MSALAALKLVISIQFFSEVIFRPFHFFLAPSPQHVKIGDVTSPKLR